MDSDDEEIIQDEPKKSAQKQKYDFSFNLQIYFFICLALF